MVLRHMCWLNRIVGSISGYSGMRNPFSLLYLDTGTRQVNLILLKSPSSTLIQCLARVLANSARAHTAFVSVSSPIDIWMDSVLNTPAPTSKQVLDVVVVDLLDVSDDLPDLFHQPPFFKNGLGTMVIVESCPG